MEEYKDVMLSEPPSRYTAAPHIQAVSLENYKGILLCDRPTNLRLASGSAGGGAGLVRQGESTAVPFLPAGKAEDHFLGLQPSNETRTRIEASRALRRETMPGSMKGANPALSRHRRWLKSFAQAVKAMKLSKAEADVDADNRKQQLREAQAVLRKQQQQPPQQAASDEPAPEAATAAKAEEEPAQSTCAPSSKPPVKKSTTKKATGKKKPKWAMTEDEAFDAELKEHVGLVDFAQKLDFSQFINDYEVREALSIMQDRVKELAAEKGINLADVVKEGEDEEGEARRDDDDISICPSDATTTTREAVAKRNDERRARKQRKDNEHLEDDNSMSHEQPWNASTSVGDTLRSAISGDAIVLAEKILATSESMRRIHTKNSLARLLQNIALTGSAANEAPRAPLDMNTGTALPPPRLATVAAEATGAHGNAEPTRILTKLRLAKDKAQNLPYLYRCPSL